ncbi:hypothetical protein SAMN02745116_01982 [Pilibacter termitis]|uniref:Uncharacterized protein n=1 Tax=Pilibacter termitis TaxID=263852 RepID=A0A1T4PXP1_9ENTE|nr:hypothetical protein [Pilibacter termitis]SJZ96294.1 hypothetical protein SAMN02745116_01982 [Pilibacter termitis]
MSKYQLDEKQKKLNQKYTGQAFSGQQSQKEKLAQIKEKMKRQKKNVIEE